MEQWYIRRSNSQTRSVPYIYGNQVETSLSSCGHRYTDLGIRIERKGRTEKLLKWNKFSFYVMVDYLRIIEIFTYLKNKK